MNANWRKNFSETPIYIIHGPEDKNDQWDIYPASDLKVRTIGVKKVEDFFGNEKSEARRERILVKSSSTGKENIFSRVLSFEKYIFGKWDQGIEAKNSGNGSVLAEQK